MCSLSLSLSLSLPRLVETREVGNIRGEYAKKTGPMREGAEKAAGRHVKMLWRGGYHDIWAACRGCFYNKMAKTKCCTQGLFAILWQAQTKGYESRVGKDGNKAENSVSGRLITSPCARQAISCVFSPRAWQPPLLKDPNRICTSCCQ